MSIDIVVSSLASKTPIRGKKALQKLVYFCNVYGVPTGCSYKMYLYGPYSHELAREYESLVEKNILSQMPGKNTFLSGSESHLLMEENQKELREIETKITSVVNLFGGMTSLDLELYSTVHFVADSFISIYQKDDPDNVVAEVKIFKGDKFTKQRIKKAYEDLKQWGLLN